MNKSLNRLLLQQNPYPAGPLRAGDLTEAGTQRIFRIQVSCHPAGCSLSLGFFLQSGRPPAEDILVCTVT